MTDIPVRRAVSIAVVLMIAAVGLLLVAVSHWRVGVAVLGLSALVGGAARLVLPDAALGVLAVRSRVFDTAFMLALGASFEALAIWKF
ncbi:MAG: DUF3017 domain-containing protein [Nakamurella sp.]